MHNSESSLSAIAAADLNQAIWPKSALRNIAGALEIAGVDCRDLVVEYQSPVYVLDEGDARTRARIFRESYETAGASIVYYAAKAFLATAIARLVTEEGLGIDVASGGELAVVLRAGVPGDRILMHGNNKSMAEIEMALAAGVGRIVVDSFDEIVRVADAATRSGMVQQVLVRVTVGVEAHTHEFIATAHEDQKFGLSVASGDAAEAIRRIVKLPSLSFAGLHSHIGSQIFDASGFEEAARRVAAFTRTLREEQAVVVRELNLGGGMGIAYVEGDDPLEVAAMAQQICSVVRTECELAGIELPELAFEPGRAIIGPAGVTIYEVGTVKPIELDSGVIR
ncbi:MAG: diaminopimelate decarboxylase, partial [Actinobacteria bacterium]|nr:diaminopimelate decarboxylase [Actinomycetota bacterium]